MKPTGSGPLALVICAVVSSSTALCDDWPCWRGPNADSVADGRNLPVRWTTDKNVRWGLDKQTGEIAWRKDRPIGTAHATPLLVEHDGQTDILVPGKNRLTAFDTHTHAYRTDSHLYCIGQAH